MYGVIVVFEEKFVKDSLIGVNIYMNINSFWYFVRNDFSSAEELEKIIKK